MILNVGDMINFNDGCIGIIAAFYTSQSHGQVMLIELLNQPEMPWRILSTADVDLKQAVVH